MKFVGNHDDTDSVSSYIEVLRYIKDACRAHIRVALYSVIHRHYRVWRPQFFQRSTPLVFTTTHDKTMEAIDTG